MADYERYSEAMGVVELPKDFDIVDQVNINTRNRWLERNKVTLIGVVVGVALLTMLSIRVVARRAS